jgi:glycosyltransferase involved in cell wall biosynthesis
MKSTASSKIIAIIITNGRWPELRDCLESLHNSVESSNETENIETHLGLNGVAAPEWLKSFPIRIHHLESHLPPPEARNEILVRTAGDYVLFLDDDVVVPPEFFRNLKESIDKNPQAAILGGPNLTFPRASLFEKCSGHALASRLGTAGISRRYSYSEGTCWTQSELPFTLCNLCLKKSPDVIFKKGIGLGEETELLQRLLCVEKAFFSSKLFVWHHRRKTVFSFLQQMYKYGKGRGVTLSEASRLRQFQFAILLGLYGSILLLLGFFPWVTLMLFFLFYTFSGLTIFFTEEKSLASFFYFPLSLFIIHFAYPIGILRGLVRV